MDKLVCPLEDSYRCLPLLAVLVVTYVNFLDQDSTLPLS